MKLTGDARRSANCNLVTAVQRVTPPCGICSPPNSLRDYSAPLCYSSAPVFTHAPVMPRQASLGFSVTVKNSSAPRKRAMLSSCLMKSTIIQMLVKWATHMAVERTTPGVLAPCGKRLFPSTHTVCVSALITRGKPQIQRSTMSTQFRSQPTLGCHFQM